MGGTWPKCILSWHILKQTLRRCYTWKYPVISPANGMLLENWCLNYTRICMTRSRLAGYGTSLATDNCTWIYTVHCWQMCILPWWNCPPYLCKWYHMCVCFKIRVQAKNCQRTSSVIWHHHGRYYQRLPRSKVQKKIKWVFFIIPTPTYWLNTERPGVNWWMVEEG